MVMNDLNCDHDSAIECVFYCIIHDVDKYLSYSLLVLEDDFGDIFFDMHVEVQWFLFCHVCKNPFQFLKERTDVELWEISLEVIDFNLGKVLKANY